MNWPSKSLCSGNNNARLVQRWQLIWDRLFSVNLNVVFRKTTIRNFPLADKLIILKTRRQSLFRLPFFLSYFLIIWSYLGMVSINAPTILIKYLVFSVSIRYFFIRTLTNKFILLPHEGWQKELPGLNHSNLKSMFVSHLRLSLSYVTIMLIMDHLVYFII